MDASGEGRSASFAVTIEAAVAVTGELVDAFAELTPQLSSSSPAPGRAELEGVVGSEASTLFVARAATEDGTRIVGSLTLVMFRIPTGLRAFVEDVVVDDAARGRGVGAALVDAALDAAARAGARTVDLTSRPTRTAANRLYERMGFARRESNLYRMDLAGRAER